MATLDLQVRQSTDDVYRALSNDDWGLVVVDQTVGARNAAVYRIGGGMRFTEVSIPKGATISTAYLTLRARMSDSAVTVNSRISAEDVDNAVTFADDKAAFDTRWAARTTAKVDWDNIAAWTATTDYNSPEIKTVIQEIIDRGGWASGNAIVIFWDDFARRSTEDADRRRRAVSYDSSSSNAPKLHIEYTAFKPTVTTGECFLVTGNTCFGQGNIIDFGESAVTQYGHVWSTSSGPTTGDSKTPKGAATQLGPYPSYITGLLIATLYYVNAYATNSYGTGYGSEVQVTTTGYVGGSEDRGEIKIHEDKIRYKDAYGTTRDVQGHETTSDQDILYHMGD